MTDILTRVATIERVRTDTAHIVDFGTATHWPGVDEDIGLSTFLGVSEDVIYDALGWEKPSVLTEDHPPTAGAD